MLHSTGKKHTGTGTTVLRYYDSSLTRLQAVVTCVSVHHTVHTGSRSRRDELQCVGKSHARGILTQISYEPERIW